mgnify:CR=1 FL=1|tara:strand:- start:340 stop:1392 length:1053 start_codon:yes stop_codon:yes gene_type:complete
MAEIRKVKGGRAVHYENLPNKEKVKILNYTDELKSDIIGKRFKGKGSEGSTEYKMRQGQEFLKAAIESIKDRFFPLTEEDTLGLRTSWLGYATKEEAEAIVEQASSRRAKGARWATGRYDKEASKTEITESREKFVSDLLESKGNIMSEGLVQLLDTYLSETESYGTETDETSKPEKLEKIKAVIDEFKAIVDSNVKSGECFTQGSLDSARTLQGVVRKNHRASRQNHNTIERLIRIMRSNLCGPENATKTDELQNFLEGATKELSNPDDIFDRAPRPPEDMYDRRPKNPEVAKSWWDTLKDAGAVNMGNPGTKAMFNNKAINPPKGKPKKEKKPKTYPIVPEDKDFWRD